MTSRFVHPVEGDWNGALHLGPGDLGQVLGVEDEEVARPLGARSHHDGQQDSWGRISNVSHGRSERVSHRETAVRVLLLSTVVLVDPVRRLDKQGLGGVRVWFLPHPGLLGFHVQLADLNDE